MQKASATRVLFYQFFALSTSDETYEQMFTDKSGIEGSQPHDCTNELLKSDWRSRRIRGDGHSIWPKQCFEITFN